MKPTSQPRAKPNNWPRTWPNNWGTFFVGAFIGFYRVQKTDVGCWPVLWGNTQQLGWLVRHPVIGFVPTLTKAFRRSPPWRTEDFWPARKKRWHSVVSALHFVNTVCCCGLRAWGNCCHRGTQPHPPVFQRCRQYYHSAAVCDSAVQYSAALSQTRGVARVGWNWMRSVFWRLNYVWLNEDWGLQINRIERWRLRAEVKVRFEVVRLNWGFRCLTKVELRIGVGCLFEQWHSIFFGLFLVEQTP